MIAISSYLNDYYCRRMKNDNCATTGDLEMDKWSDYKQVDSESANKLRIVYAGSPGSGNKDRIDIVINILSQLKEEGITNFHFTIVGMTEKQFNISFNTNVPKNISCNVTFKGRLTHTLALNEVKKSHFNLFLRDDNLSNNAGFPTKFVESISCGTPVLTNSTSNIKDYLVNGKNGFLITDISEQSIKNTLREALELPIEEVIRMKELCKKSKTFDYRNFISTFSSLFQKLDIFSEMM